MVLDDIVQYSATSFNRARRRNIVLVASDEDRSDVVGVCDDHALAENFRRVPATTVLWQHGVADMTTDREKAIVQPVANRRTTDDRLPDFSKQEGRRYPGRRQLVGTTLFVERRNELPPGQTLPVSDDELETLSAKGVLSREHDRFIRQPDWAKPQIACCHAPDPASTFQRDAAHLPAPHSPGQKDRRARTTASGAPYRCRVSAAAICSAFWRGGRRCHAARISGRSGASVSGASSADQEVGDRADRLYEEGQDPRELPAADLRGWAVS